MSWLRKSGNGWALAPAGAFLFGDDDLTVMLYKSGGDQHLPQHGGYFSLTVVQEADVDGLIADGWSLTPDEALAPAVGDKTPELNTHDEPDPVEPEPEPETAPKRRGRKPKAAE